MQFCFINCLPQQSHLVSKCSRQLFSSSSLGRLRLQRTMLGTMKHRSHLFLATECKFAPANLLGEQMRPASRCFEYIQLELESYPALASLYRLWSGIPITRNLMKNYTAFWIRRVRTPKNNAKRRYFTLIFVLICCAKQY